MAHLSEEIDWWKGDASGVALLLESSLSGGVGGCSVLPHWV